MLKFTPVSGNWYFVNTEKSIFNQLHSCCLTRMQEKPLQLTCKSNKDITELIQQGIASLTLQPNIPAGFLNRSFTPEQQNNRRPFSMEVPDRLQQQEQCLYCLSTLDLYIVLNSLRSTNHGKVTEVKWFSLCHKQGSGRPGSR